MNVLFSEPVQPADDIDHAFRLLERALDLHVHGVTSLGSSTIAHRFVADEPSGSLVLRLVRSASDAWSIELVAVGADPVPAELVAGIREDVRAAVAELDATDAATRRDEMSARPQSSDSKAGQGAVRPWLEATRRGYLAPGDPPPPSGRAAEWLDYRGVALWDDAQTLARAPVPLGRLVDLRRRTLHRVGLPEQALSRHALVLGPPGSGKTQGLLLPWASAALRAGWSVVLTDAKADLGTRLIESVDRTQEEELRRVRTIQWSFSTRDPMPWDWLSALGTESRVAAAVDSLLGRRDYDPSGDRFFRATAGELLTSLLRFVHAAGPAVRSEYDLSDLLVDTARLRVLTDENERAPGSLELRSAVRTWGAEVWDQAVGQILPALHQLQTTSSVGGLDQAAQYAGLGTPSEQRLHILDLGPRSSTPASLLLGQFIQEVREQAVEGETPRVLFVLDEGVRLMDRLDLSSLLTATPGGSAGGLILSAQDLSQITRAEERALLIGNVGTFAIFANASAPSVSAFHDRLGLRPQRWHESESPGQLRYWEETYEPPAADPNLVPILGRREIARPPGGGRPALVHVRASGLHITSKPLLIDTESGGDDLVAR